MQWEGRTEGTLSVSIRPSGRGAASGLFPLEPSNRTRFLQRAEANAQEDPPEYQEKLVYCTVTAHWNRLPRAVVEVPSLEILGIRLNSVPLL